MAVAGKTTQQVKNELATVKAFKRLGITDIKPRINVLTFRKWTEKGMRPLEKSKAVRVANLRLWHVSQCRPMTADELKANKDQPVAAVARHKTADVVQLNPAQ
jgi:hypothetical protein